MTENKRFFIHKDMVSDTEMKIPVTLWQDKEQQKKFCDELNKLNDENEQLKQENQELHRLNHEEVESWSDEKKQMIAEFSNLMFGDKINDRKQKNNWKNKY